MASKESAYASLNERPRSASTNEHPQTDGRARLLAILLLGSFAAALVVGGQHWNTYNVDKHPGRRLQLAPDTGAHVKSGGLSVVTTGGGRSRPALKPPSPAHRFAFLSNESPSSVASVRQETAGCGKVAYDSMILHAPFETCDIAQLHRAISSAWREELDGPLHIRGCAIRWFTSAEACAVLQATGVLVLTGDSLMRHVTQALKSILIGDYANATDLMSALVPPPAEYDPAFPCSCTAAYDDGHRRNDMWAFAAPRNRYCREHTIAGMPWNGGRAGASGVPYCPSWTGDAVAYHDAVDLHDYTLVGFPRGVAEAHPRGVVLVGGGLHFEALNTATVDAVFGPAARLHTVPTGYRRVCALLHSPGGNKPEEFRKMNGLNATLAYNALIEAQCGGGSTGDSVFSPFTATANASSIDGQHYPQQPNVIVAQLLLNHLHALNTQREAEEAAAVRAQQSAAAGARATVSSNGAG